MIKISHTETILENQKFTVNLIYKIPVSICTALMMGLLNPFNTQLLTDIKIITPMG